MHDHPSHRTLHCWHLSGTHYGNAFNYLPLGWRATLFAWEEQVKKHGRKRGLWQFLAWWLYWGLFFVLFCFNESLLSCCQLWSKSSCTESLNFPLHGDRRLHHPGLNAMCGYFQLVMPGNSPTATARASGEARIRQELQTRLEHSSSSAHPFQSNPSVCVSPQALDSYILQKEKGKREIQVLTGDNYNVWTFTVCML